MRASIQRETGMTSRWRRVSTRLVTAIARFFFARGQAMTARLVRFIGRERHYWRLLAMFLRQNVVCSVLYRRHVQTGRLRPCNGSTVPSRRSKSIRTIGLRVTG